MSANNNTGYRPVTKADGGGPRDEDVAEQPLGREERCLCGALQRLASPYVFGACVCLLNFFLGAASTATG